MDYVRPYDPATKLPSTNPLVVWRNEDVESNIEGSIPPAEFFHRVNTEIVTAISQSGQTPSSEDLGQLWTAIRSARAFDEDITLNVPSEFETIQEAIRYAGERIIETDRMITIQVAAGTYELDAETGPIITNHPYGHRIRIVGASLTGAFPTALETQDASSAVVEAFLRGRFPTVIECRGTHGIFQQANGLNRIENLLFVGDASPSFCGLLMGEWRSENGQGNIRAENCWFHGFGAEGIRANYNSNLSGRRLGATHCGGPGFRAANNSGIQVGDSFIAQRCSIGMLVQDCSMLEGFGALVEANFNGIGVQSASCSIARFDGAALLRVKNNTTYGLYAQQAMITAGTRNVDDSGNMDILADVGSSIYLINTATGTPTLSPAANTTGNRNSIIVV